MSNDLLKTGTRIAAQEFPEIEKAVSIAGGEIKREEIAAAFQAPS